MTTDLEAGLRREFDAAGMPTGLTFHAESVLRQGNRTIRRRRIVAAGSAALAVAIVAAGAGLLTRPDDRAVPLPASSTATTGVVLADAGFISGHAQVEFDRDVRVKPNVRYFFITQDGRRHEVGNSSTGMPGQKPDAVWIEDLTDTGFAMFYVDYSPTPGDAAHKEPRRPSEIASIRWIGPPGIVDGIEGDHRLTGRALTMGKGVSVQVVLGRGEGGRTTVFGQVDLRQVSGFSAAFPMSFVTTNASGVGVVTGRQPLGRPTTTVVNTTNDGPPIAAGILPAGSSGISVLLTTGVAPRPVVVSQRLPDGRVIFAIKAEGARPSDPSTDSIKAVTWTNADGSPGRKDVTQKQG